MLRISSLPLRTTLGDVRSAFEILGEISSLQWEKQNRDDSMKAALLLFRRLGDAEKAVRICNDLHILEAKIKVEFCNQKDLSSSSSSSSTSSSSPTSRSRSPIRRASRSRSPVSRSPIKRSRSRSPVRRRSRSPIRRIRSPVRNTRISFSSSVSRSPIRRSRSKSRSPIRNIRISFSRSRSRSPRRSRSRSPITKRRVSIISRSPSRSRSPIRRISRSPIRRISRSPIRRISRSPIRRISRSPIRRISRSPIRRINRSPIRRISRSPIRRISRSPIRRISRSPIRRISRSRSPNRKDTPSGHIFFSRSRSKSRSPPDQRIGDGPFPFSTIANSPPSRKRRQSRSPRRDEISPVKSSRIHFGPIQSEFKNLDLLVEVRDLLPGMTEQNIRELLEKELGSTEEIRNLTIHPTGSSALVTFSDEAMAKKAKGLKEIVFFGRVLNIHSLSVSGEDVPDTYSLTATMTGYNLDHLTSLLDAHNNFLQSLTSKPDVIVSTSLNLQVAGEPKDIEEMKRKLETFLCDPF